MRYQGLRGADARIKCIGCVIIEPVERRLGNRIRANRLLSGLTQPADPLSPGNLTRPRSTRIRIRLERLADEIQESILTLRWKIWMDRFKGRDAALPSLDLLASSASPRDTLENRLNWLVDLVQWIRRPGNQ